MFDLEPRITDRIAMLQSAQASAQVQAPDARQARAVNDGRIGHLSAVSEIWQPSATRRLMPLLKPPPRRNRAMRWLTGDRGYAAFISYRRQDAEIVQAVRLSLEESLGKKAIFFDLTCLDPGAEFPERLIESLLESRSVVVVIGRNWLGQRSDREQMRIELPSDWVRREVEFALEQNKTIVPVLLNRDSFPVNMLMQLSGLQSKNFEAVFPNSKDFDAQMSRIVDVIRRPIPSPHISPYRGAPSLFSALCGRAAKSLWRKAKICSTQPMGSEGR